MTLVVDASIALSWIFEDESAPATDAILDRLRDEGAIVPALFGLEVANVLLQAEKRRRVSAADSASRLELLAALPITVAPASDDRMAMGILKLARDQGLTTYDAAYLELAMRTEATLCTRDKALAAAATRLQVPLLP